MTFSKAEITILGTPCPRMTKKKNIWIESTSLPAKEKVAFEPIKN